jgi:hypothetical protein
MLAFLGSLVLLFATEANSPQLPVVTEIDFAHLQEQARNVIRALDGSHRPLPAETVQRLKAAFRDGAKDPDRAIRNIQEALDPMCLIAVTINPESRVKAARGPCAARLIAGRETSFLIKVYNDAGVTHSLEVTSPQLTGKRATTDSAWMEGKLVREAPMRKSLTGHKVEYAILRLRPAAAGKREATLKFDVGQGTQDLGFRAEVPVLFTIEPRK